MTESTQKSRLLYAFILSLVLHFLLFVLVGNIDWSRAREATPYLGPLVVELVDPPSPVLPEPIPQPVPEPLLDPRVSEAVPEAVPAPAAAKPASSPTTPRASTPPRAVETPAPGGDAYADLFAGVTDTAAAGGRDAPEPVDREDQVAPRQFSNRAGLETAGAATVTSGEQVVTRNTDDASIDSLDPDMIEALDASLAEQDNTGNEDSPGSSETAETDEKLTRQFGDDSLIATRSLADRARPLPPFSLDEELRAALRRGEHSGLEVDIGFTVTPGGILKDLHILHSSGNTSLDQELMKVLRVSWTFQPASNVEEEEGRIIIRIKVE